MYEPDVVCPTMILDETHERRRGMYFQGVRSFGFFGAVLGRAGMEIKKGGGGEVATVPTWATDEMNPMRSRTFDRDLQGSPVAPPPNEEKREFTPNVERMGDIFTHKSLSPREWPP